MHRHGDARRSANRNFQVPEPAGPIAGVGAGQHDQRVRPHRRLILTAAAVLALAAGASAALLLRDSGPAREGSPAPAATTGAPESAESYLRQVCGQDVDLTQEANLCVGRTSLSP